MSEPEPQLPAPDAATRGEIRALLDKVVARAPREAAKMLLPFPDAFIVEMLTLLNPAQAQQVLERIKSERRQHVLAAAPAHTRQQWMRNERYRENTVGHMMEPPLAVFQQDVTVGRGDRGTAAARRPRLHHLRLCHG